MRCTRIGYSFLACVWNVNECWCMVIAQLVRMLQVVLVCANSVIVSLELGNCGKYTTSYSGA